MANTYFNFKKFTINQNYGFKISTEACLLGAYVAHEFNCESVLDIGTGTGVLSLMYAQKHPNSEITAVEIDKDSFEQASSNFNSASFTHKITPKHISIVDFADDNKEKYDLIICNPPFFKNHLLSTNNLKDNSAKHQLTLTLEQLAYCISKFTNNKSKVVILLPIFEQEQLKNLLLKIGLYPVKSLLVRHNDNSKPIRNIQVYSSETRNSESEYFSIYDLENNYNSEFIVLLKDYYIFL